MNRIKNIISIAAFSLLVMGLPAIASAQYGNGYPGGGNGSYGNNGRNGGNNDSRAIVRDLKERTRQFKAEVDRMYSNRGRGNSGTSGNILIDIFGGWGTSSNGRYNDIRDEVRQFKSAVDRLDNDGRGNANEIRKALDEGADMDRAMSRLGNNGRNGGRGNGGYGNGGYGNGGYNTYGTLQSQWQAIRSELQRLSRSYPDNGRGRGNWPF